MICIKHQYRVWNEGDSHTGEERTRHEHRLLTIREGYRSSVLWNKIDYILWAVWQGKGHGKGAILQVGTTCFILCLHASDRDVWGLQLHIAACGHHGPLQPNRALSETVRGLALEDTWNQNSPSLIYTHYSSDGSTRIDRIYLSPEDTDRKTGMEIMPAVSA